MPKTPVRKTPRPGGRRGFALLSAATLMAIMLAFGALLVNYLVSTRRAGNIYETAVYASDLAEAGITKALFCLNASEGSKCGGAFGNSFAGESNVPFSGGKFTVTVSGAGTIKTIAATGTTNKGQSKSITVEVTSLPMTDNDLSFGYALQTGNEGIYFANNSALTGTIYSSGDVVCQSILAVIDGDAFSAMSGGKIDGCKVNYNAHADKILNSNVIGDAYYKNDPADIAGTTVGGTKFAASATPAAQNLPSMNLDFWHQAAAAGGVINGGYAPADNSHLGPKKIIGDLSLGQNVDIILDGPVWVVGDIIFDNNVSISLNYTFGAYSTTILADDPLNQATKGKIHVINNTAIYGSGNPKSHVLIATTNTSNDDNAPAMLIQNNAAGAIFYALNGTMRLSNNGGAKAMSARRLYLENNAIVTYLESEMSDQKFSNSPGGVWRVIEGSWREERN